METAHFKQDETKLQVHASLQGRSQFSVWVEGAALKKRKTAAEGHRCPLLLPLPEFFF